jgi:choline kinase
MRVIILAAGQGTRLRPFTNDKPKCMVELKGKPLIEYQLDLFKIFNITDINVVTGYLADKINYQEITKFYNPKFDKTNMVYTLFCAKELFDRKDDILISYGDIIYNESVLNSIIKSDNPVNVVVDKNWKEYWSARMDNPLKDAETLKINDQGQIKELGKHPLNYDEIDGQYIGLIMIKKEVAEVILNYYDNLDKKISYDGKKYEDMYMTSFLQMIADNLMPLFPVYIENGWMEVDCASDLKFSGFLKSKKYLNA